MQSFDGGLVQVFDTLDAALSDGYVGQRVDGGLLPGPPYSVAELGGRSLVEGYGRDAVEGCSAGGDQLNDSFDEASRLAVPAPASTNRVSSRLSRMRRRDVLVLGYESIGHGRSPSERVT